MKKFISTKFDVKTIVTVIIIVAMTCVGVRYMEYDWCEPMSGVMWIIGEMLVVAVLTYKEMVRFIMQEAKELYTKMIED